MEMYIAEIQDCSGKCFITVSTSLSLTFYAMYYHPCAAVYLCQYPNALTWGPMVQEAAVLAAPTGAAATRLQEVGGGHGRASST